MKKTILTSIALVLSVWLYGQVEFVENQGSTVISGTVNGYYITPQKTVTSIKILKSNERERAHKIIIPKQDGHEYKVLYPNEIIGYGFEGKNIRYCSATIYLDGKETTVFLEEFIKGDDNVTIYIYNSDKGELFFVQRGKQLAQLITDNGTALRNYFKNKAGNCSAIDEIDRYPMKMTRSSILKMYEAYTKCNLNVFSRFRYGITGGAYIEMLKAGDANNYKFNKEVAFYPGIFVEIPLDIRFSFRPEVIYMSSHLTGEPDLSKDRDNIEFIRKSIYLPLMFRYKLTQVRSKYIPYFELGPTIDFRISGERGKPTATLKRQVSPYQIGGALGAGVEYKMSDLISLYAGLRYNASRGASPDETREVHNLISLNLSVGF